MKNIIIIKKFIKNYKCLLLYYFYFMFNITLIIKNFTNIFRYTNTLIFNYMKKRTRILLILDISLCYFSFTIYFIIFSFFLLNFLFKNILLLEFEI